MLESLANLSNILGFAQNTAYIILYEWSYFNYLYLSIIFYVFSYVTLHRMVFVSILTTSRYIILLLFTFLLPVWDSQSLFDKISWDFVRFSKLWVNGLYTVVLLRVRSHERRNELKLVWDSISVENLTLAFSQLFTCVHMNWGEMKLKTV